MNIRNARRARGRSWPLVGAVLLSTSLSACLTFPVKESEIEWRHSTASKSGCPDLTGDYFNDRELFGQLTGGVVRPYDSVKMQDIRDLPRVQLRPGVNSPRYVAQVRQQGNTLEVALADMARTVYAVATVPLDVPHIGCTDGALVIHSVANTRGSEGGVAIVYWSEIVVRKAIDGSLVMSSEGATRNRSRLTGKATGPEYDRMARSWRFSRVDQ